MAEKEQEINNSNVNAKQQERLKRRSEVEAKDEELKNEDPKVLRQKLSNKNEDYVFRLEKELQRQGSLSREEAVAMTDGLLGEIVIAQRHGQPASGLYMASPKIKADEMLHPEQKPVETPFWQRAVDGGLLYFSIFVGLFGIIALFENNNPENSQMGILTLASVGILMGVFMVKYNDWVMPKDGQRMGLSRLLLSGLGVALVLFVLIWVLSLPALRVINPVLPGAADIVLAAIAYGVRYLFRKHYHITGSSFAVTPPRQRK